MVWTKRGHPSLYIFIYVLFFSIHFVFQLAFEIFYLVLVFFSSKLSRKHFLWGKWNVTPPWNERGLSRKAGHDLIRVPLKRELSVF